MGVINKIAVKQMSSIETIKRLFEMHIPRAVLEAYTLPAGSKDSTIIVGLSGGADSSVLALFAAVYLAPIYPNMVFLFTDTKSEPASCYKTLDLIEELTGITVTRLEPEMGLFELIDSYNGFLPSGQARYCTRELKVKPLLDYMKSIPSETGYVSLAGIRYDEADRDGIKFQYSMETNAAAAFPFIDLEITKKMVFDILDRSIGVPATYQYRSRSGCFSCFFQRGAELIGMLANEPVNFQITESYEKLTAEDETRWANIPTTLTEAGFPAYYPVPAFIDVRKPEKVPARAPQKLKNRSNENQADLFSMEPEEVQSDYEELFAAFALYSDGRLQQFGGREFTPGTYFQELVTISTSLSGIKSALGNHYQFKRTTPMPHYDLEDMQIVIAQIRFPAGTIDKNAPSKDSFTWKSNMALKQLRHLVRNCQVVLQKADIERRYRDALAIEGDPASDEVALMAAAEQVQILGSMLAKLPSVKGELVWEGLYTPSKDVEKLVQLQLDGVSVQSEFKPARETLEHDEVPRACVMCSV